MTKKGRETRLFFILAAAAVPGHIILLVQLGCNYRVRETRLLMVVSTEDQSCRVNRGAMYLPSNSVLMLFSRSVPGLGTVSWKNAGTA